MRPTLVDRPPIHLVGLRRTYTPATMPTIPALWDVFVPRLAEVRGACGDVTYGVCECGADGSGTFGYTAAIGVEDPTATPPGMVGFTLPAGTWAVFEHHGDVASISATFDEIAARGLAAAGLERRDPRDLEVYDERFDPATDRGTVEIWVPVHPPAREAPAAPPDHG